MWKVRRIANCLVPSTEYLALSTLFATAILANTAAGSITLHVSPAGNDKAAGTADKPLKSLAKALEFAGEGDTIELAPGKYDGEVKTRVTGVTISGQPGAILSSPGNRGIEVLHDKTVIRGLTIEKCDIGIWIFGANDCLLEGLTVRDIGGEGIRIKNQSCHNTVRKCDFQRMGREGFDAPAGKKNGEGVYIGTAPEQRSKNQPPNVPDRCTGQHRRGLHLRHRSR